jgi:hypothetical protein
LLLAVAAAAASSCAHPPLPRSAPAQRAPEVRLSLLAVGDWGRRPVDGHSPPAQLAVGEALARADLREPADALVFVGDNFYPSGLEKDELEPRLRLNVAAPYCHFVKLTARGESALGSACEEPEAERHVVPFWVTLGNHDHHRSSAPVLEAEAVPEYVANWRLYGRPVETLELPQGVSLVFYDSTVLRFAAGAAALPELTRALANAKGPWRILIAHHPFDGTNFSARVEGAIAAAGVRPQLHLVGHIHDLRGGELAAPLPPLQIVSGGGGGDESGSTPLPGETFKLRSLGFARVDLVAAGGSERLRVRLYAVDLGDPEPRVVAGWTIGLDGRVDSAP